MTRRVEDVEQVGLLLQILQHQCDGHRFDRDAALLLREEGIRVADRFVLLESDQRYFIQIRLEVQNVFP